MTQNSSIQTKIIFNKYSIRGVFVNIFKLPKMTKEEMWKLIRRRRICRIAFKGAEYPYMAPFQYVTLNGTLYFHFTDYGKAYRIILLVWHYNFCCNLLAEGWEAYAKSGWKISSGKIGFGTCPMQRLH